MAKKTADREDSSSSSSANFCSEKYSMYKKKRSAAPNSAASKFMSVVSDDLFLEILLRFPDGRSVMQYATVCKRWYSLTTSTHSHKFKVRFIQFHLRKQSLDSSSVPAYNTVFLFNDSEFNYGPYYQICSEKPKHYDLRLMPNSGDLAIRAASEDLLLVSCDERHYLICNAITKQWLSLPEVPRLKYFGRPDRIFGEDVSGSYGFAIVRNPVCTDEDRFGYKAVIIYHTKFLPHQYYFGAAIFDSETGIWTVMRVITRYPMRVDNELALKEFYVVSTCLEIAVDSNGVLHWLDGNHNLNALFVFDPMTLKSCFVWSPCSEFNDLEPNATKHRVRLGVVRGQVRLSLMQEEFRLKVWELISESKTWVLVYDIDFEKTSIGKGEWLFFVLAFDPNDGNVVALVRDENIYMYEIEQDKCDKVCEFPYDGESVDVKKQRVAMYLKVLTPVLPLWPTPTLSFSST